jgi:hypothetical protein
MTRSAMSGSRPYSEKHESQEGANTGAVFLNGLAGESLSLLFKYIHSLFLSLFLLFLSSCCSQGKAHHGSLAHITPGV